MRIAYIVADPGIPVFGTKGACVHIQEVIRQLRHLGHQVTVYAIKKGTQAPADLADLPVIEYPIAATEPAARERGQMQASAEIARRVIADGVDLVYERYSLFSTALAEICEATGASGVLEVNAPLIEEQKEHRVLVNEQAADQALNFQVAAATATICVSELVTRWVRERTGAAAVHTVPNGVSTTRITPQPEDQEQVVVTFVGTLKPWHGTEDLLTAASLAQQPWQVRIIGDGPERQALQDQAERLRLNVDFRGAVEPSRIPEHLAGSAIGVAPYPDLGGQQQYFSPLKVYEYLAAGLPVVASGVGQLPQILRELGTLVPPSNPTVLAQAIDELAADPARRAELGKLGRAQAVAKHSWEGVVAQIMELVGNHG